MCWIPIDNLWTWLAMETDMDPVGRVRISPCRTGHTVSIHPHYSPDIYRWISESLPKGTVVWARANLPSYTNHMLSVCRALGVGGGAVRTVQIKSWHDRPHLMSLLSWVDKSIKPSNCYYSDTWLLKYSQALQLDMAHFLFNCWNMTCFSCSGFSVLYIDILYIDMKLRHTSIKRSSL